MDFTVKELNDKYYNGFEFKSNNCTVILIKSDNSNKYILDFLYVTIVPMEKADNYY